VVIGIIALLIAILLPALQKANAAARTVQCLANLKQVGSALNIYVNDHQGTFPIPPSGTPVQILLYDALSKGRAIKNYDAATVFRCPSMGDGELGLTYVKISQSFQGLTYQFVSAYTFNEGTFHWSSSTPSTPTITKIGTIPRPAEYVYATDGRGTFRIDNGGTIVNATYRANVQSDIDQHVIFRHGVLRASPTRIFSGFVYDAYQQTNVLYMDGHAAGAIEAVTTADTDWRRQW
jgi:prepilin-type processing-associated H-X9-DG protein